MFKQIRIWKYLWFVILAVSTNSCDDNNQDKAPKKASAGYNLPVPTGWKVERIAFPINFAPQISYSGFEDLRFMPGWGVAKSEEYWSYAFLWWLNGSPKIDSSVLQENTSAYYTGLVRSNASQRNIPPAVAMIKKIETSKDDDETYSGTITITDYMNMLNDRIVLNCRIHKKNCAAHTALFFEISPKPLEHKIWEQLNKLQEDFKCGD